MTCRHAFAAGRWPAALLVLLLARPAAAAGWLREGDPPPAPIDPPVGFLADAPTIDGFLDAGLEARLPAREFPFVVPAAEEAAGAGAPATAPTAVPARFRIAYGTHFLYLQVEADADSLTCRDRGYQNGDGFHLVIAAPREDGAPSREFYVIACTAVDTPEREWQRRLIWYRNVDDLLVRLGDGARLEFAARDGRIQFELLLPWSEIPPFHPWLSPEIGFNLCFVKAVGTTGREYHYLLPDGRMQSEASPRWSAPLRFAEPALETGSQTFVLLPRGHLGAGRPLPLAAATLAAEPVLEELRWSVGSAGDDSTSAASATGSETSRRYEIPAGVSIRRWQLPTAALQPGEHVLTWSAGAGGGTARFTVLPPGNPAALRERLALAVEERASGILAPGSRTTLEFLLDECEREQSDLFPWETAGALGERLGRAADLVAGAEAGEDVLTAATGPVRRAFRSADGTLQPYAVLAPASRAGGATEARATGDAAGGGHRHPVVVYLHGSGSDETSLFQVADRFPPELLVVAPYGRGPSHCFATEEARRDVAEALADAAACYPLDLERVAVVGFSMGGYGALHELWSRPDVYRGAALFSAHPDLANRWLGAPPGGGRYPDFTDPATLDPLAGRQMFVFHGERDRNAPFALIQTCVEEMRAAGAEVAFHPDADRGHESPPPGVVAAFRAWLADVLEVADRLR
ncbi:MAG: prolyl oligopeptidase family serine peptidase [Candidatus Krumholzibacteriia bacterium]